MRTATLALCLLLAALAGCASQREPETRTVEVKVPVRVPCISNKPEPPIYRYGTGEYPGEKEAARLLAEDFEVADQYGRAWAAAAAGCLIIPQ